MPNESRPIVQTLGQIPVMNSAGVKSVYANAVAASGTLHDFTLHFTLLGQDLASEQGSKNRQEVVSVVTLPVAMIPALMEVLQQVVENHDALANAHLAMKFSGPADAE